jgi:hypothetical protein
MRPWYDGMTTPCPAPADLLLHALQPPSESRDIAQHTTECTSCRATVTTIREIASVLQLSDGDAADKTSCLDEMTVARVVERGVNAEKNPEVITHLAVCARCREQVASVAALLREAPVASEIERSAQHALAPVGRRWRVAGAGALMALAASMLFVVKPPASNVSAPRPVTNTDAEAHREQSVTTTLPPGVITPVGTTAAADTFRWTSVPRADRYRLTVFDREGRALWEAEVNDTTVARPDSIAGQRGTTYLWKVEARTGWDRWVASDLVEFSVANTGRIP